MLAELIETNNVGPAALIGIGAAPDFVVKEVKGPPSVTRGGQFTAAVTICNQGTTSGSTQIDLVLSRDATIAVPPPPTQWDPAADRLAGGLWIQLQAGACEVRTVQGWAEPPAPALDGTYYLGAIVDYAEMVPELIKSNNASPASPIGVGWGPDLVVKEVKGPPSVTRGGTFNAQVTVCNQGTAAGGAQVDLLLSHDAELRLAPLQGPWDPSADRLLGGAWFQLQAGACETRSLQG
jgi:hypothetical protein